MSSGNVIAAYECHARQWVQARRRGAFDERGWLDRFSALLPVGGAVLDCGCGAGEPMATYLVAGGYSVTGIDASTAMTQMFRARLPGQVVMVGDMRELSLDRTFDGILAWDSFFHLNHENQRRMFPRFAAHSHRETVLMFTSGPTHGEAIGSLEGEPLYHASLNAEEYRTLLKAHGFSLISTVANDSDCGGRTVWLAQQPSR